MRRSQLFAAVAAALACIGAQIAAAAGANAVIHAGQLLAVPGQAAVTNATVVVADGKVREIRSGFADAAAVGLPADTAVINLRDKFVMPGFLDLHVHLSSSGLGGGRDLRFRESEGYFSLVGARSASATLMAGFTTVRDLGSEGSAIFALRDASRDGLVAAPKIIVS
jgi:imidazolonepropionase-like amidohydrolase